MRIFIFLMILSFGVGLPSLGQAQPMNQDLCPKPGGDEAMQTPNDLAAIQSDIERFALCVRRAQLLDQLNKLATKNDESLIGADDIERLTEEAFKTLPPVAPVNLGIDPGDFEASLEDDGFGESPMLEDDGGTAWLINDIYGVASNLKARIVNQSGEIANVQEGDVLSDGLQVAEISQTSIKVLDNDESIYLKWAR